MIFNIILHITKVFYKIYRHYAKCQFFLGKEQNILFYVTLHLDSYNYNILLLALQIKFNFYLLLHYYHYINILLKLLFTYYNT
jgi:hypothetical protein